MGCGTRVVMAGRTAALVTALMAVLMAAWPALAMPANAAAGSVLGVSAPADPVTAVPGQPVATTVRLSNGGTEPLTVRLAVGTIKLGDRGEVTIDAVPDPVWAASTRIAEPTVTLAAQSWFENRVVIEVPAGLRPDTYFVGILVTPQVPASGSVTVVNEVGTYVGFDVPGPRQRSVRISELDLPGAVFGGTVPVRVRLVNDGPSFATAWGELHVSGPGRSRQVVRLPGRYRLAAGSYRDVTVSVTPGFGAGMVKVRATAFYNVSDQTVAETTATASVWVVSRAAGIGAAAAAATLLGGAILLAARRWRRRRRAMRAAGPIPPSGRPHAGRTAGN